MHTSADPIHIVAAYFLIGILTISGLVQFFLAWRNRILAERSRSWPTVQGQIAGAWLSGDFRRGFLVHVSYWYRINGYPYTGTRLAFGDQWQATARLNWLLDPYRLGTHVTVHYDPQNPRCATLETRAVDIGWSCIKGIIALALATILILVLVWG